MDEKQIDELFEALYINDEATVIKIAGFNSQHMGAIKKEIMKRIEQGNFQYFLGKKEKEKYRKIFVDLLSYSTNIPAIKDVINQSKQLNLESWEIRDLIIATNKPEYIKSVIEDKKRREEFGLSTDDLCKLIVAIKDVSYIKECIEDGERRERLGLNEHTAYLIKCTKDIDYIKSIIEDEKKRKSLGLKKHDCRILLEEMGKQYIIEKIEDENERKSLQLDLDDIVECIIATRDQDYIRRIIEDKERRDALNWKFSTLHVKKLLAATDEDYINKYLVYLERQNEKNISSNSTNEISLPENMTIGVEIESEGENSFLIRRLKNKFPDSWQPKHESSLIDGVEVISPILSGDTKTTTQKIRNVCSRLKVLGQKITERCGGHNHIGADYLTEDESFENLVNILVNTEGVLYIISNKAGEVPRNDVGIYAKPFSRDLEIIFNDCNIELENGETFADFIKAKQSGDRQYGINFMNLGSSKNTIEFRIANGTLDENTWIENINLFGGIVRAAEYITQIQKKSLEQRTEHEKMMLLLFGKLKKHKISEKEKLEILLFLAIPEENREIYKSRYEINRKLIEQNKEVKESIFANIANEPMCIQERQGLHRN